MSGFVHQGGFERITDEPLAPATPATPSETPAVDPSALLNRELMWLEFNRRVLHQAMDERTPLLERVGFLAIFNSNLDEFFQKRVGGLKRQVAAGLTHRTPDGMTPAEQLAAIRQTVLPMLAEQADCFERSIRPQLAAHNIHLLSWSKLTEQERRIADDYFRRHLFPVLTPLAVDPGHPFPFISNLSTSLGVMLRDPQAAAARPFRDEPDNPTGDLQFARVKVPPVLPHWVRLNPEDRHAFRFVKLADIIRHNLDQLFQGMEIVEVEPFRVTRSADVEREQEDAEDLLELIEQELRDRRFAKPIRLELDEAPSQPLNRFLIRELGLDDSDVYQMPAELDYTDLWTIHALDLPELKFEPWVPVIPPRLADDEADIFSVIRNGEVMVHHPYESFAASVERFIRAAANDPDVIAIKLTLYRTSADSPFIPELIRAAESGKQVVCLVELKARFDEQRNVQIAQRLEKAGVHVVYGIVGYKTHTKTALVVRQEGEGMQCYAHVSTGNYNPATAQLYTDLGLFTCDPRITGDLVDLFHYLTGRSVKRDFPHLIVAPSNMRQRFIDMIEREIAHTENWRRRGADPDDPDRPRIIAKMNSLEDHKTCRALYRASQAGVRIDLIVRGFCCLRPGVEGLSENIRVSSIIGRFLEHSRIFHFHNAGEPEFYIGSADWMYRNLNNRVECTTPIYDPALRQRLWQILQIMLHDHHQAWDMQPDGSYLPRTPPLEPDPDHPEQTIGAQARFMQLAQAQTRHLEAD